MLTVALRSENVTQRLTRNFLSFSTLLAFIDFLYFSLLRGINNASQDIICFPAAFLTSKENIWSIDWNSHCLTLPFELELTF